ncbi:hypothetical protein BC830DRAFT_1172413 [Chytriomyces sp. MP71]|nr:hypothetical protein BC830DRAFT_1172413 [Chytriomyces sp. MP71]
MILQHLKVPDALSVAFAAKSSFTQFLLYNNQFTRFHLLRSAPKETEQAIAETRFLPPPPAAVLQFTSTILQHPSLDPTVNQDHLFHPRINVKAFNSIALTNAAAHSHADLVRLLLCDGRCDPLARASFGFLHACERGFHEVSQYLQDGRQDPHVSESAALVHGAQEGYVKLVEVLLSDGRLDPTAALTGGVIQGVEDGKTRFFARAYGRVRCLFWNGS